MKQYSLDFSVQAWLAQFKNNILDFLFALDVRCSANDAKTAADCLKVKIEIVREY
jgi:hypothetical protein